MNWGPPTIDFFTNEIYRKHFSSFVPGEGSVQVPSQMHSWFNGWEVSYIYIPSISLILPVVCKVIQVWALIILIAPTWLRQFSYQYFLSTIPVSERSQTDSIEPKPANTRRREGLASKLKFLHLTTWMSDGSCRQSQDVFDLERTFFI